MIKAIIIEDEIKAGELLKSMLGDIDKEIEVVEICVDLTTAIKSIKKIKPAIVFLDIELPIYSGLQILDFLNEDEINFKIIFVTASNKYAIKAFEMSAIDYIMKPIEFDKLKQAIIKFRGSSSEQNYSQIQLLKHNLKGEGIKKIIIPTQQGFEIISTDQIIYIKAEGSYSKITIQHSPTFVVSKNLKYFEELLINTNGFCRVHRSYLVNLHFAKRILQNDGNYIVLQDDIEIPLVADKFDEVISIINRG